MVPLLNAILCFVDFYLYIETSYPRTNGQVATLRSPTVRSTVAMCLTMKAHMYGINVNALKVFKVDEGSGAETELWKKTGNQGNKWFDVKVDLPPGAPFQVRIMILVSLVFAQTFIEGLCKVNSLYFVFAKGKLI